MYKECILDFGTIQFEETNTVKVGIKWMPFSCAQGFAGLVNPDYNPFFVLTNFESAKQN